MSKEGATTNPFTARDFELLVGAMSCTKGPIEIDYKKFAEGFGFKNSNSSKAAWHGLKKKLEKASGSTIGGGAASADADDNNETPAKGSRKRKTADDVETEADGAATGEAPAAKKSTPRKRGGKAAAGGAAKGKAKSEPAMLSKDEAEEEGNENGTKPEDSAVEDGEDVKVEEAE